jgi:hypothetical protein
LEPVSTKWSPLSSANVFISLALLPESDSVKQYDANLSQLKSDGKYLFFISCWAY